jgi:hypothetical protein
LGAGCALALFVLLLVAAVAMLASRGVSIQLDSEELALHIREQVEIQAKASLPKMIAGAKAEIPRIVREEMQDQLSDRMEIAGFVFTMPAELMNQLESNLQKNVENATGRILDGIDTKTLALQFGQDAYRMVRQTLQEELHGQTFMVFLFDRIPVPVHVTVN